MKILHVSLGFSWCGAEGQALLLMKGLRDDGHEQALVCQSGSLIEERARSAGFDVLDVDAYERPALLTAWRIRNILRDVKPQIVHCHDPAAHAVGTLADYFADRICRTVVSRRTDASLFRRNVFGLSKLKYLFNVGRIIVPSRAVREIMLNDGIPDEMIAVVRDGIRVEEYDDVRVNGIRDEIGAPEGAVLVGTIGSLVGHKGQRYLLEAVPAVLDRFPHTRFVIVGDGPLAEELRAAAEQAAIEANVIFTGFRRDVLRVLKILDLFVSSSHLEGIGTTLLEAAAAKVPIVATYAGGIPEIIRNAKEGLLAPVRDANALADRIVYALSHQGEMREMADAAYAKIKAEYPVERMVEETLKVYYELMVK